MRPRMYPQEKQGTHPEIDADRRARFVLRQPLLV